MEINLNLNFGNKKIKTNGVLLIILIIATLLRFYNIGFQEAWVDEIHTLRESDTLISLSEFHQIIMLREGIPHFYFLLIRFISEIFGNSIVLARSVSAVSGIISVYFIYKLGKELYNKNAGYIAALFLTFNVYHIEYSQEARSYAMLAMFTTIAYYFLIKFIKNNTLKNAILLGAFAGLITNAHPMGLLNLAGIYLTLFIALVMRDKNQKAVFFKQSFYSGCIALLVFWPVYQIVSKVSEIKVFWVPEPTLDRIKAVLSEVSGKSILLLYIVLFFFTFLAFYFVKNYKKETFKTASVKLSFITLLIWVLMCAGVLIIESYNGPSLILHRYFIGNLPAFMLILAIGVQLIPSQIVQKLSAIVIIGLLIAQILYPNNYYTTITKAQFSTTCTEVLKGNPNNDRIISSWGWLVMYYVDRESKNKNVLESTLQSYLEQVKDNALDQESFWYIDGNSKPYNVTPEIQQFIDKEFIVTQSIEHYDIWAKHFISKKIIPSDEIKLNLANFSDAQFDGSGKLTFFETSKKNYKTFNLDKGKYEIEIMGNSLPEKPIKNENAIMNLYINGVLIDKFTLSEKPNSITTLNYNHLQSGKVTFTLEFTNDLFYENLDRNAQISKINLKKIL